MLRPTRSDAQQQAGAQHGGRNQGQACPLCSGISLLLGLPFVALDQVAERGHVFFKVLKSP